MKPVWSQVARSSGPVLKVKFLLVIGSLLAAAAAGIISLPIALSAAQRGDVEVDVSDAVPQARGFAEVAVASWLAGVDLDAVPVADGLRGKVASSGLPGASVPRWDRFTRSDGSEVSGGVPYELHTFTTAVDGQLWEISALVLLTDGGPVLGAPMSLLPVPAAASDVAAAADWGSVEQEGDINRTRVVERLEQWAAAYASGDSAQLQQLAGDDRAGVFYPALSGMTVEAVQLVHGFVAGLDGEEILVVRGRFTLATGAAVDARTAATVTVDLDLFVADHTTSLPRIVAWGPPGSALTLAPFSNAVITADTPAGGGQ